MNIEKSSAGKQGEYAAKIAYGRPNCQEDGPDQGHSRKGNLQEEVYGLR